MRNQHPGQETASTAPPGLPPPPNPPGNPSRGFSSPSTFRLCLDFTWTEHCCVGPSPSPCLKIHLCYSHGCPVLTAGGHGPCGQALQFGALQVGLPRAALDGCLVSTDAQEWNLGVTVDPRGSSGVRMGFPGRGGGRCGRGLWSVLPASLPVAPITEHRKPGGLKRQE